MIASESYIGTPDFWNTLISVVFGVGVGGLGAWVAFRASNPKKRLFWGVVSNAPLIASERAARAIRITQDQEVIEKPRIVRITIRNAGRKDIRREDYDSGPASLVFDLHAPVKGIVSVDSTPSHARAPEPPLKDGNRILVQPFLMKHRQTVTFSVLVDGEEGEVTCSAALLDTPVKNIDFSEAVPDAKDIQKIQRRAYIFGVVVAFVIATAGVLLFPWETTGRMAHCKEENPYPAVYVKHLLDCALITVKK